MPISGWVRKGMSVTETLYIAQRTGIDSAIRSTKSHSSRKHEESLGCDSGYIQSKKLNHPQVKCQSLMWKRGRNDVAVVVADVYWSRPIDFVVIHQDRTFLELCFS